MRTHKDWDKWDDERKQKYVDKLERVYPDGHPYSVFQSKTKNSPTVSQGTSSNGSALLGMLKDQPENLSSLNKEYVGLYQEISSREANGLNADEEKKELEKLEKRINALENGKEENHSQLSEADLEQVHQELKDYWSHTFRGRLITNTSYLAKSEEIIKEQMKPFEEGEALENIATATDHKDITAVIARNLLYKKYTEGIENEKLRQSFEETVSFFKRYEDERSQSLSSDQVSNMVKTALPYVVSNQQNIRDVKFFKKGNTGHYSLVITPKKGNKVLVSSKGDISNLKTGKRYKQRDELFTTLSITSSDIESAIKGEG